MVSHDWLIFCGWMTVLVLYLMGSALTEMGTKWPWKK
jgi:hypothetical protein